MRIVCSLLKALLVFMLLGWGCTPAWSEVLISEFMASNTRTLADGDNDYSDWLEILNSGDTPVSLNGWALTDDPDQPRKWRFPNLVLAPGQHLIVFASGKDRRVPGEELHTGFKLGSDGDFLGLADPSGTIVQHFGTAYPEQLPDVSFGIVAQESPVTLISADAPLKYFVPADGTLAETWTHAEFDDSAWISASNRAGFDATSARPLASSIRSVLDVSSRNTSGLFLRYSFQAENSNISPLLLQVSYDDGFAAYLNGVMVAHANGPETLVWDSTALLPRVGADPLTPEEFDLSDKGGLLHDGTNVLAIHLLNVAANDEDLFIQAGLSGVQRTASTNAWRYFVQPTPGIINGTGETNLGPLVLHATHTPALPADADSINVTARMQATFHPPASLTLTYHTMFGAQSTIQMLDNGAQGDGAAGDGIYGAIIPASAATPGQMVRWFLRATDTQGRATRWPPYRDTRNSPEFLGTIISDPSLTNRLPVLHWFIASTNTGRADSIGGTRSALFWNGRLYDNIFVNLHGQSSQGFPKKSYNLDFNPGFHFAWAEDETPVEDINLLTTYPDKAHVRNVLAYETYRDSGHAYHFVVPVRVQRNGAFFSDAHMVEDGDADFLERVGLNGDGALYKMYNTFDSATSGVEKKSRKFEGNADLVAFLRGLQSSTGRTAFIYDHVNIPAMVNYLAAMIITGNVDCCHKNYYIYRDTGVTDEWQFIPWDLDLSFGRNWTSSLGYNDDTMYYQNGLYIGNNNTLPLALFNVPAIKSMYLRRVRTLMDELMQAPGTPAEELKYEARIRELFTEISPDAALDYAKWSTWGSRQTMPQALAILTNQYFPQRRNYLFNTLGNTLPKPVTNQVIIGFGALEFNPASGTQAHEYLTLTNGTPAFVDVSDWKIEGAVGHTFAPGTVIPQNGTLYLSPDVRSFRQRTTAPRGGQALFAQGNYKGQLSARGETLRLADKLGRVIATHTYSGAPTPAQTSLTLIEMMPAPPASDIPNVPSEDLEYLVLQNTGTTPLNLRGVHFTNGISFTFEDDTVLAANEKVYLAKNPEAFALFYSANFKIAGPYLGQLANGGEIIQIHDSVGENVLEFEYHGGWHAQRPAGASLILLDPALSPGNLGDSLSWRPSAYPGGSAGLASAWNNWRTVQYPSIGEPAADADADGSHNYGEFVAGTDPTNAFSRLTFELSSLPPRVVRFHAAAGREYTVYAASTIDGPWQVVGGLQRTSRAGTVQLPLLGMAPSNTRFYRISVNL